jgi:flagella basal body P-ring formation protein FlgA
LLAEQSGVKVQSIVDVCFAWPLARLNQSVVLAALRKSFNNPDANIEIAEMTTDRVPQGDLNFPLTGLAVPASLDQPVPVIWRGELAYAGNRRLAIWARVRIDAPVTVVVAVDKLEAGHPITSNQLRTEVRRRFPTLKNTITSIEQIAGMIPLRSLPPGAEVRWGNISRPNYVNRGDIVAIEVRSGTVRLAFTGRAESAGRTGDVIVVRNQETNKTFQARVSAKDKAIVEPGSAKEDGYESR